MLGHFHWDYLRHTETVADGVFHVTERACNLSIRQGSIWNDIFLWKDMSVILIYDKRGKP
jgi:hypothetical protein